MVPNHFLRTPHCIAVIRAGQHRSLAKCALKSGGGRTG